MTRASTHPRGEDQAGVTPAPWRRVGGNFPGVVNDVAVSDRPREIRAELLQLDLVAEIEKRWGNEIWVPLYEKSDADVTRFSYLSPLSCLDQALDNEGWDVLIQPPRPCFQRGPKGAATYLATGRDDGFECLLIRRDFDGLVDHRWEMSEQFRLFHNLFAGNGGALFRHDEAGNDIEVVRISNERVRVRRLELMQYMGARQLALVMVCQAYRGHSYVFEPGERIEVKRRDALLFIRSIACEGHHEPSTLGLNAKKILLPPRQEACGIWPFDSDPPPPADYIVGVDELGQPVRLPCSEGAEFLTPVFFRREVLRRYYDNPAKFSVEDGYLRGGQWGLRMQNNRDDLVIVFLGDLVRLPSPEVGHWQAQNVEPEGGLNETDWQRALFGKPAEASEASLFFRRVYPELNECFESRFGFPLFKAPEEGDGHLLNTLRVPLAESQPEFDNQLLSLVKLLVDSLNEKELKRTTPAEHRTDKAGLDRLRCWCEANEVEGRPLMALLRDLQALRSTGSAHRKGAKSYPAACQRLGIDSQDLVGGFRTLLRAVNDELVAFAASADLGQVPR